MDAVDRGERLTAFVGRAARTPFSYATGHDCAQGFVAGWVIVELGRDPAAAWRGRYSTAIGCQRLLRREGGLVALMDRGMGHVGLSRTETPALGDAGAIEMITEHGRQPVAALRGESGWLMLTGRGLKSLGQAVPLAAWRVE